MSATGLCGNTNEIPCSVRIMRIYDWPALPVAFTVSFQRLQAGKLETLFAFLGECHRLRGGHRRVHQPPRCTVCGTRCSPDTRISRRRHFGWRLVHRVAGPLHGACDAANHLHGVRVNFLPEYGHRTRHAVRPVSWLPVLAQGRPAQEKQAMRAG